MLVYAPLSEGTRYPFEFYNYVTGKTFVTQFLEYKYINMDKAKALKICPYYMAYSYKTKGCQVEMLLDNQEI